MFFRSCSGGCLLLFAFGFDGLIYLLADFVCWVVLHYLRLLDLPYVVDCFVLDVGLVVLIDLIRIGMRFTIM